MTTMEDLRRLGPFRSQQVVASRSVVRGATGVLSGDVAYHGGITISGAFMFYNVYLDGFSGNATDFDAFTASIVTSNYYIDPQGTQVSAGYFAGSVQLNSGLSGSVFVSDLYTLIDQWVGAGILPQLSPVGVYCILLPPTITLSFGTLTSCVDFCGFHTITPGGNFVNVIADTGCDPCHPPELTVDQARMTVSSHEYVEWRSNPNGQGWWNDFNGDEIADECNFFGGAWGPQRQWVATHYWENGAGCYIPVYVPLNIVSDLYAGPYVQVRDAEVVVRTQSLLRAGHEPVPDEIIRDLFLSEWITTTAAPKPTVRCKDEALQQNLARSGDLIIIGVIENNEEWEGHRHEFVNTDIVLEIEILTGDSRQRLWDLMAECRRIIYKFIIALAPYHSLDWQPMVPNYEENTTRRFKGTAGAVLHQQGLPAFLRYVHGQEYPAAAPTVPPQKVLP